MSRLFLIGLAAVIVFFAFPPLRANADCSVAGEGCDDFIGESCCNGYTCGPGNICVAKNSAEGIQNPLKWDNFDQLVDAILRFLLIAGFVIAPILFGVAGVMIVTSSGNEKQVTQARNIIIYTAIGLTVILLAKALVSVIEKAIGVE
ncbi:MAG: hypothetical protein PHW72_00885 [Candidatus Pacebacteria bacterium]|nr:hypothetical protein [Candidatus Paceibacterota bacterium]